ncbi:MAG: hypothetical protein Ct9H300mP28_32010 [Pseudomonadota bacterium]|nr:MAG: hypothetical protein Ct9H300mP28_32010 [Pseudomonadota bacterium]
MENLEICPAFQKGKEVPFKLDDQYLNRKTTKMGEKILI